MAIGRDVSSDIHIPGVQSVGRGAAVAAPNIATWVNMYQNNKARDQKKSANERQEYVAGVANKLASTIVQREGQAGTNSLSTQKTMTSAFNEAGLSHIEQQQARSQVADQIGNVVKDRVSEEREEQDAERKETIKYSNELGFEGYPETEEQLATVLQYRRNEKEYERETKSLDRTIKRYQAEGVEIDGDAKIAGERATIEANDVANIAHTELQVAFHNIDAGIQTGQFKGNPAILRADAIDAGIVSLDKFINDRAKKLPPLAAAAFRKQMIPIRQEYKNQADTLRDVSGDKTLTDIVTGNTKAGQAILDNGFQSSSAVSKVQTLLRNGWINAQTMHNAGFSAGINSMGDAAEFIKQFMSTNLPEPGTGNSWLSSMANNQPPGSTGEGVNFIAGRVNKMVTAQLNGVIATTPESLDYTGEHIVNLQKEVITDNKMGHLKENTIRGVVDHINNENYSKIPKGRRDEIADQIGEYTGTVLVKSWIPTVEKLYVNQIPEAIRDVAKSPLFSIEVNTDNGNIRVNIPNDTELNKIIGFPKNVSNKNAVAALEKTKIGLAALKKSIETGMPVVNDTLTALAKATYFDTPTKQSKVFTTGAAINALKGQTTIFSIGKEAEIKDELQGDNPEILNDPVLGSAIIQPKPDTDFNSKEELLEFQELQRKEFDSKGTA